MLRVLLSVAAKVGELKVLPLRRHTGELLFFFFFILSNFYSYLERVKLRLLRLVLCQIVYPGQISDLSKRVHMGIDAGEGSANLLAFFSRFQALKLVIWWRYIAF